MNPRHDRSKIAERTRAQFRARLFNQSDGEFSQALLRVAFALAIAFYMGIPARIPATWAAVQSGILVSGLAAWLVLSIGIFLAALTWPGPNPARRVLGILADVAIVSLSLFFAGEAGVALSAIYLLITFGNGFRYGTSYLLLCQLLSVVGLSWALIEAPWWRDHPTIGLGLMLPLIVLPLYVSTLARRLAMAREQAELALKACLERNRDEAA